ncbi:cyclase family protein [Actinomycetota bacterium]
MRFYDLAQPLERGMPVSPNHPSFQLALMRRHGDMVRSDGGSAANEIIVMGGHVGTHVDALCHVSQEGLIHGGLEASEIQSQSGFSQAGIETMAPVMSRGVLLDVAAVKGVDVLPADYEVTAEDLEEAEGAAAVRVEPGDAVLIRTGWSRHWSESEVFRGQSGGAPGPGVEAAQWLVDREVGIAGAETIAFERIAPGEGHSTLPVHRILLVEAGVHIIEVMNLEALGRDHITEFLFLMAPLRLVGATGSPVRPLAIVDA